MSPTLKQRIAYYRLRASQLIERSRIVLRTQGISPLFRKAYRWLILGERTYVTTTPTATAAPPPLMDLHQRYTQWLSTHLPTADQLRRQRKRAEGFTHQPLLSIVIPVYNPPTPVFREALQSILAQTYPHFEVCLANGGQQAPIDALLTQEFPDERIRIRHVEENLGIAGNTNIALGMAQGEYVVFMDHDDRLSPQALFRVVEALNDDPSIDILYSDADKLGENGLRYGPLIKPEWSPELLHNTMYTGHMSVYRRTLVEQLGGLRPEFDGSQDYDLILRASEVTQNIHHLPYVLYQWRAIEGSAAADGKPEARRTNLAALQAAMERRGYQGQAEEAYFANRFRFEHPTHPLVSIIIPTDDPDHAHTVVEGLLTTTDYPHYEVIVVTNSPLADQLDALGHPNLLTVRFDEPFNFSRKCNQGATAAQGDYLLFLNDDVSPLQPDWLHAMMEYAQLEGVGGVSAKLLYTNGTIQYAGMVTGVRDFVGTSFHTWPARDRRRYGIVNWVRNVSVLSGACVLLATAIFEEIDGWDEENTPIANSDLDFSFRLSEAGYRLVYTPHAELQHVGHVSIAKVDSGERRFDDSHLYMLARWGDRIGYDPFFPPNMRDTLYHEADGFKVFAQPSEANLHALRHSKKLLLVTHDLSLSGAPIILAQLAATLHEAGYFVTVVSPADGPLRATYQALDIPIIIEPHVLRAAHVFRPNFFAFDLVIANTVFGWPAVDIAYDIDHKSIWLVHESEFGVNLVGSWGHLPQRAFKRADAIIHPAKSAKRMYALWANQQNQHVIYYGISDPLEKVPPQPAPPPTDDRLNVVFVGSIEPRKGVDTIVDMLLSLPTEAHNTFTMTFVGRFLDPHFADKMKALVADLPNVTFAGEVPHTTALQYMAECDIYLCASRDETGPIVVMEALAFSKPVITTDVGAVGELVEDGVNGFVVPVDAPRALREKLLLLLEDPVLRQQLGQAARQLYEKQFRAERYSREMLTLIEGLLAEQETDEPTAEAVP